MSCFPSCHHYFRLLNLLVCNKRSGGSGGGGSGNGKDNGHAAFGPRESLFHSRSSEEQRARASAISNYRRLFEMEVARPDGELNLALAALLIEAEGEKMGC